MIRGSVCAVNGLDIMGGFSPFEGVYWKPYYSSLFILVSLVLGVAGRRLPGLLEISLSLYFGIHRILSF